MDFIHLALSIAVTKGWEFHQIDVNNAFLHGDLSEDMCMGKPQGFMQDYSFVCRLKKYIYHLKESLREWYGKMDSYMFS